MGTHEPKVPPVDRYSNPRAAVSRLVTAWIVDSSGLRDKAEMAFSPPVLEPKRRVATLLSDSERDEVRTLHAAGVPSSELAARFGVHRQTIWRLTRQR
jgi:hypothetical protein